ncbi:4Fe-4S ferredoxin iron-sulfur binding domain protein [Methylobacterium sp. 4-46]|uniref:4Fe-4S dicluster domain-containing protein n=1 Tax=unclassified Methylobacterium TaxID=2615210 RepID=UPI000165CD98|nr:MULTISPECIES: 4Fe-4S dicluster domain-containing protein [Methylobacterium]ACA20111.1 4Fe-4S ferredoxin iron-sulfur binding domain protein [Methylobacterium sp. 4-46]WFT79294.1 4Fe-4S dicluster domain-containing protein [Methylobacterium nodulans]
MPPLSGPRTVSRREALRAFAAGITLAAGACAKPDEEIVPYVVQPERVTGGVPLVFASTLPLAGYGRGCRVRSVDGRPIKVEGNPRHPGSLGATDVFAEAAVLSLYDPDRSKTLRQGGDIGTWSALQRALVAKVAAWRETRGEGMRLLTGRVTSPTLQRQIARLLDAYPRAAWHAHEPTEDASARAGAALAFGRPLWPVPHLDRAAVIVSLDADPLGPGPDQIRNGRGFGSRRVPAAGEGFSRLYAVEAAPTLTGAKADHRLALPPHRIGEVAVALARALGADLRAPTLPEEAARLAARAAQDLRARRGAALVLAGPTLPPEIHALAHWINGVLGAPLDWIEPPDLIGGRAPGTLSDLARDLAAGGVQDLVMLGVNPVYDAPADLALAERLGRAPFRLHLGPAVDETAVLATWHVPETHPLEAWGDLRAVDGTASLVQPLIRPLYATRTAEEVVCALLGEGDAASYDLVRETWRPGREAGFEEWWRRALHEGVVQDSAAAPVATGSPRLPDPGPPAAAQDLTLVLRPDPGTWDGRMANNAWLQECPAPLTKQVWGNALALAPDEAARRGLAQGDLVRVAAGGRSIEVPVATVPGHAAGVASLTLGHGRSRAGAIGNGIGASAYALRREDALWRVDGVALAPTGQHPGILTTQRVVREREARENYPLLTLAALAEGRTAIGEAPGTDPGPHPSLIAPWTGDADGHAWAMVIDASLCIGCNACVVACQTENNVPVVGPEEVARGRLMHWLRVDTYDRGGPDHPRPGFQPVPCMHCEHAPCEPVCPVAASVHDGEGLNLQVYNRCIGTRFCEANCPYKVRRFNFLGYADGQEYANLGLDPLPAQRNPEVTVRQRGVMEKCTYCIQRISGARRAAERDGRPLGPGEVTTACQDACPSRAIAFGDLAEAGSDVARLRAEPRHYALLGHLGTRPRTTYLADLRNPAPDLPGDGS